MDKYMVAIIDKDSDDIIYLGYSFNYDYHAQCLIDYATERYQVISGFESLDYMNEPNLPIYYLLLLKNIVFTNVSVDDKKRGMLYLPKDISSKQLEKLSRFLDEVSDFDVTIIYDLLLNDGMVIGKELPISKELDLKHQSERFISQRQYSKKKEGHRNG